MVVVVVVLGAPGTILWSAKRRGLVGPKDVCRCPQQANICSIGSTITASRRTWVRALALALVSPDVGHSGVYSCGFIAASVLHSITLLLHPCQCGLFVLFLCFPLVVITLPKPDRAPRTESSRNESAVQNPSKPSSSLCPHVPSNVSRPKPDTDAATAGFCCHVARREISVGVSHRCRQTNSRSSGPTEIQSEDRLDIKGPAHIL